MPDAGPCAATASSRLQDKASGKFAGLVGPWFPVGWPEPEIAWTMMPEFQGKGLAKEAAVAALRFAYREPRLGNRCFLHRCHGTTPSVRLAESLGATREGKTVLPPLGEALLYRHLSPADFLAKTSRGVRQMNDMPAELKAFRASIDNLDAALIHILAERFRITKAVGELKAASGMAPADPERERQQVERLRVACPPGRSRSGLC